jgi:hypothetical protein
MTLVYHLSVKLTYATIRLIVLSLIQIYLGMALLGLAPGFTTDNSTMTRVLGGLILAIGSIKLLKIGRAAVSDVQIEMNEEDLAEVKALIQSGEEVPAMTVVREKTGATLAEAKEYVEALKSPK